MPESSFIDFTFLNSFLVCLFAVLFYNPVYMIIVLHSWSSWFFELMALREKLRIRQNITVVICEQVILKYGGKKKDGQITNDESIKPQSV